VIQAKGASVKPEPPQTVGAAFALARNAASLPPRPMARRKRAFCPGTALPDWPLPDNEFRLAVVMPNQWAGSPMPDHARYGLVFFASIDARP
jgi:hypothetical protein